MRTVLVPPELEGPLDRAVRALFDGAERHVSWGTARAWIAAGKVRIGGAVVTQTTARVHAGMEVTVHEQARKPRAAEIADDAVVYLDAHLVVVSKPPGVSTVPYDDSETDTLDARVRRWLVRRAKGKRGVRPNLGVVHRLDKETSGLLVFTRTWLAKQALAQSFRKHTVHRKYLAIAHGDVRSRTIRSFFVEDRGDGLRGSVRGGQPSHAREAVTHVERIESFARATLVACRLQTGRTHQIRIHLSEAGHPLLGERVYVRGWTAAPGGGPSAAPSHGRTLLEAPRLMLHAAELGFVHPATEQLVHWKQPMPADMRAVLERLIK